MESPDEWSYSIEIDEWRRDREEWKREKEVWGDG
jgi:hypothetical protein